ncbi:MAG: hypothetical protein JW739_04490 [Opitutales bacterium]|nr:hypothetical protein [Opitutales bacterium]
MRWRLAILLFALTVVASLFSGCDDAPTVSLVPVDKDGNTRVYDSADKIYSDHCQRCHGPLLESSLVDSAIMRQGGAALLDYLMPPLDPDAGSAAKKMHSPSLRYVGNARLAKLLNYCNEEFYGKPPQYSESQLRAHQ